MSKQETQRNIFNKIPLLSMEFTKSKLISQRNPKDKEGHNETPISESS